MKRAHRRIHRLIWPILALSAAVIVGLALALRADMPLNPALPATSATAST